MAAMVIPKESPDPSVSSATRELLENQISTAKPLQKPASFSRSSVALLAGADICMFLISTYLAASIVQGTRSVADAYYVFFHTAIIFIAIWLVTFQRLGLYKCTIVAVRPHITGDTRIATSADPQAIWPYPTEVL